MMNRTIANSFIDNHDTQRSNSNILTYRDGSLYKLASVFELGWPYGYAQIMSSYAIIDSDHGPPANPIWDNGRNTCFDGNSQWICEHRSVLLFKLIIKTKTTTKNKKQKNNKQKKTKNNKKQQTKNNKKQQNKKQKAKQQTTKNNKRKNNKKQQTTNKKQKTKNKKTKQINENNKIIK